MNSVITRHYILFFFLPVVFLSPTLLGLGYVKFDSDVARLWGSSLVARELLETEKRFESHFAAVPVMANVLMVGKDDVLAGRDCSPLLLESFALERQLVAMRNGSFHQLCFKPDGQNCMVLSPAQYWDGGSREVCNADSNRHVTVSQNFHKTNFGMTLSASQVFGNISHSGVALVSAGAIVIRFVLQTKDAEERAAWMNALLDLTADWNQHSNFNLVVGTTPDALAKESMDSLSKYWFVPVLSVCGTLLTALLFLGLRHGLKGIVLGAVSFTLVIISVACSTGIVSFLGLYLNPIMFQVVPVLVLAISLDITFVLASNMTKGYVISLFLAVISICLSFSASLLSFTYVAKTVVATVCTAVLINFILQACSLSALLVWMGMGHGHAPRSAAPLGSAWYKRVLKFLLSRRRTILAVFLLISCASFVLAVARLRPGIEPIMLAPTHSAEYRFLKAYAQNFESEMELAAFWVIESESFDAQATQDSIATAMGYLQKRFLRGEFAIHSPLADLVSWILFLSNHAPEYRNASGIPPEKFTPWMKEFLNSTGKLHAPNVVFDAADERVMVIRCLISLKEPTVFALSETIQNLVSACASLSNSLFGSFFYSPETVLVSQFFDIGLLFVMVLLVALGVIVCCSLLLFFKENRKAIALTLGVCLTMMMFDFLAFLVLSGLEINAMVLMSSVTGIGLSAEYLLLLLYAINSSTKGLVEASASVAIPLLVSVGCSCVGMTVLLIGSDSLMLRLYFAAVWLVIFILGAIHAFVVAPLILSFVLFNQDVQSVDSTLLLA
jgi:hypothetical protein